MSGSTAVVHLVRRGNAAQLFEAFMSSYEREAAGHDHELVLLLKGFESPAELEPYRRRAGQLVGREVQVDDSGGDLAAYLAAARQLPHDRLLLLNSHATIASPDWLGLLSGGLDDPGTGMVGATGSWASNRSLLLWRLGLPNGYRTALADRRDLSATLGSIEGGTTRTRSGRLMTLVYGPVTLAGYPGFPAPHVRTNGFLIDREVLLSMRFGGLRTKRLAHRFEAGRASFTNQLARRGLTPRVVCCDGRALAPPDWPDANVFWQGDQRNLLIADNQTRAYDGATAAGRDALARLAWGEAARRCAAERAAGSA